PSLRLPDRGARHGWQRCGAWVQCPDDPRGISRQSPAAGLAGAPRSEGTLSRRPPYRAGRTGERADPSGYAGGVAWRWRIRWDAPTTNSAGRRLVICVPHGVPPDGVVGRRDLSSRHLEGVSQARHPRRVIAGGGYTRSVWTDYAHRLLGQGMESAPVFGHQYGFSRGGVSLVRKAFSDRNLFL